MQIRHSLVLAEWKERIEARIGVVGFARVTNRFLWQLLRIPEPTRKQQRELGVIMRELGFRKMMISPDVGLPGVNGWARGESSRGKRIPSSKRLDMGTYRRKSHKSTVKHGSCNDL